MIERIIIAGSGGQGVMLLGKVLAQTAMLEGRQVSWFPAYGPEVRGGTSYCMVTISDSEIGSPYITGADTLIILNRHSLEKFIGKLKGGGLLILNSSLAKINAQAKIKVLVFPFTDMAIKLGNIKVANMVALGCFAAAKKIIKVKNILKVFKSIAPAGNLKILEVNQQALAEGQKLNYG
ncbi:MAG: 2-oxoacid:acceptor oxidoreductase family protein [Candidatus Omnitrophica bacterium]|nr:2-oxoacid:acceptor oxidoreductase family protein [Candidatus Omnitrophota bacterium]MBU4303060.1 2-oxoacid:acceptor oxidoreductase family protein [Candidatus Omnitrophota bacterium]MBU4418798.1 2-oxoacid:acceptor oxidoreductase family protein [Candidatus Omnitrophota bacterium]MBU4468160.1 2-oxoacid:acceptor oxidoreductase family protein [Candidatus Omnitrophota bacterium]MCG2707355.1 2-oxoacid:acceptor oxidoreductase family protein [Candidatus Omnitrophota bacterium]